MDKGLIKFILNLSISSREKRRNSVFSLSSLLKPTIIKFIYLTVIAFTFGFTSSNQSNVYLCDSDSAKKYHLKKDCRGLNACDHEIIRITLTEAKQKGKTLCGWED